MKRPLLRKVLRWLRDGTFASITKNSTIDTINKVNKRVTAYPGSRSRLCRGLESGYEAVQNVLRTYSRCSTRLMMEIVDWSNAYGLKPRLRDDPRQAKSGWKKLCWLVIDLGTKAFFTLQQTEPQNTGTRMLLTDSKTNCYSSYACSCIEHTKSLRE